MNETKELKNIFSSVTKKTINVLDNKHKNNEDEAFVQFIWQIFHNLKKTSGKKIITDALFSPLQKM